MSARCRIVCLFLAVLLAASAGRAGEPRLIQQVYAVSDLVTLRDKAVPAAMSEDRLIKLITRTIAPRSWSAKGGRGTIDYFPTTMSLVVNQTPDVQDQISDLLAALRRRQDMQVCVEVKFVDVAAKVFEDLQQEGILGKQGKKTHAHGNVAFLDDTEVLRLMDEVQSDVRSNVMQVPRLTTFSGQTAKINCNDEQVFTTGLEIVHCGDHIEYRPKTETVPLGTRIRLRSAISADRRFVRVHFDAQLSNLASGETALLPIMTPAPDKEKGPDGKPRMVTHYIEHPQVIKLGVKRTLNIPDDHTAVLTGFKGSVSEREGINKYGPPILSKIPILGDLFCNIAYSYETHHLLVLVTPRIIIQTEEEEKCTGYVPSPAVVP